MTEFVPIEERYKNLSYETRQNLTHLIMRLGKFTIEIEDPYERAQRFAVFPAFNRMLIGRYRESHEVVVAAYSPNTIVRGGGSNAEAHVYVVQREAEIDYADPLIVRQLAIELEEQKGEVLLGLTSVED